MAWCSSFSLVIYAAMQGVCDDRVKSLNSCLYRRMRLVFTTIQIKVCVLKVEAGGSSVTFVATYYADYTVS